MREDHKILILAVAATAAVSFATSFLFSKSRKSPSSTKLKLYYFDIVGKGECIRLACAQAGIPLEDVRIPLDDRKLFEQLKNEGKLMFGQLPAVQLEDGTILTQTSAIMRYIGKLGGLYPTCMESAALVDAVMDEEVDLFVGLSVSKYKVRQSYLPFITYHFPLHPSFFDTLDF